MLNRFFSRRRRLYGGSDTLPEGMTMDQWLNEQYRRAQYADTQPPMYPLSPDLTPTPMVFEQPPQPIQQPIMSPQELSEALYQDFSGPEDEPLVGLQFSEDEEEFTEETDEATEKDSSTEEEQLTEEESSDSQFTEPESDYTRESYFSRNQTPYSNK